jgi:hypothetical protein
MWKMSRSVNTFWPVLRVLSVQNIRNIFLILSCTPFCPQNSLNTLGHWLYNVLKAFHRDAGPYWLQCFPQLCQVDWMSFGWWTVLDTHGETQLCCNIWHNLNGAPGTYYLTRFKGTSIFCLAHSPWMTHIHNPCLNYLKIKKIMI